MFVKIIDRFEWKILRWRSIDGTHRPSPSPSWPIESGGGSLNAGKSALGRDPNQEGMRSVLVGRYGLMGNNVPQLPPGVLREY